MRKKSDGNMFNIPCRRRKEVVLCLLLVPGRRRSLCTLALDSVRRYRWKIE